MRLKFRILHIFLVLLLGLIAITSLVLLEVFERETPMALIPVPKNAEWVIRVDLVQLAKDEAYTVLFEAKDEQLITMLRSMTEERVDKLDKNGSLSLDLRHSVLVFGTHEDTNSFVGIIVQVLDPAQFQQHIGNYLTTNQTVAFAGTSALILTQQNKKILPKTIRQELAVTYLKRSYKRLDSISKNDSFLTIELPGTGKYSAQKNMLLSVHHEAQSLELRGTFEPENTLHYCNYGLKSTGLYIHSSIIPAGISDSINRLLPLGSFRFPEIRSIMLDYQGIGVEQSTIGIMAVPQMNLIVEASMPFSIDSIFAALPPEMVGANSTILFGSATYQVKQLDKNTVFIGLDISKIERKRQATIVCIKGSLKPLLEIKGSPFILAFLDVIPAVGAGRNFVNKTEKIDLTVRQTGKNCIVEGSILFKKETYALHETIKLFVGMNLLN